MFHGAACTPLLTIPRPSDPNGLKELKAGIESVKLSAPAFARFIKHAIATAPEIGMHTSIITL
ncbi:hypothetical protein RvVAR031_08970 [Agrobacterium vitis]|nr:hypothetical protein RvVAR031_08970 [Agrobacterium vitis]